jgi:hypothetical protein
MNQLKVYAGLAALLLTACTVASIVTVIGQALTVAEQAAAVTGVLPPEYVAYVEAASECIAFAAEEEASSDSPEEKAIEIAGQCGLYTQVTLPSGAPANVLAMAVRLTAAIQAIISDLPKAKPVSLTDVQLLQSFAPRAHAAAAKMRENHGFKDRK